MTKEPEKMLILYWVTSSSKIEETSIKISIC